MVAKDLRPNGLAFTPDEIFIYLVDTTGGSKTIVRYTVHPDDTYGPGQLFMDVTSDEVPGGPDGMKVDQKGILYRTGPGGLWMMSPDGKHLGAIMTAELPANLAFGDADHKTLDLTARTGLYRIRWRILGIATPGSN